MRRRCSQRPDNKPLLFPGLDLCLRRARLPFPHAIIAPLQSGSKKAAPAAKGGKPAAKGKVPTKVKEADPLYPARPKSFRIGQDVLPKRDLSRFVKWPAYVRLQRQKRILFQRLKIPPAVNQFRKPLDRAEALPMFKLLAKYKPESHSEKRVRLKAAAEKQAAGGEAATTAPPPVLKFGLNHITYLIEQKKAKLVVIASDVDPIELVVWLPALCRRMGVPYAIVNNKVRQRVGRELGEGCVWGRVREGCGRGGAVDSATLAARVGGRMNRRVCVAACVALLTRRVGYLSHPSFPSTRLFPVLTHRSFSPTASSALLFPQGRLGTLVHQKKATALALTSVKKEDAAAFEKLVESSNAHFANNAEARRKWGGGIMGLKTQRSIEKREKMVAAELAKKALL